MACRREGEKCSPICHFVSVLDLCLGANGSSKTHFDFNLGSLSLDIAFDLGSLSLVLISLVACRKPLDSEGASHAADGERDETLSDGDHPY